MSNQNNHVKDIPIDKRIIFALDIDSVEKAKEWVIKLKSQVKFFKIGLQLFLAGWFNIVDWIIKQDLEVMLDLKFFDIPQTVASAVKQTKNRNVSFVTVHGNDKIIKAAVENKNGLKILAVTVLTSLDEADIKDLGFSCSTEDLVLSRAKRALKLNCDGVVSSGLEAPKLREKLGKNFLVVVPGIRPVTNNDDQKRIVDVKKAFLNGADHIVVGRPIKEAKDPLIAVDNMQIQIQKTLEMMDIK